MLWLALGLLREGYPIRLTALQPTAELADRLPYPEPPETVLPQSKTAVLAVPTVGADGLLRTPTAPEPLSLQRCFSLLPQGALVLCGTLPAEIRAFADARQITVIDLLQRPELAELNAIATAEGAVALAMEQMSATLFDANCAVVGYGRCGSALCRRLAALGAHVTASARRPEQLARIYADGFTACPTARLSGKLSDCEVVFNTVPAPVLTAEILQRLSPGCILIELASAPGGIDRLAAAAAGLTVIDAPGLPGKVAPRTAGEHLQRVICDLLEEREDSH